MKISRILHIDFTSFYAIMIHIERTIVRLKEGGKMHHNEDGKVVGHVAVFLVIMGFVFAVGFTLMKMPTAGELVANENARISAEAERNPDGKEARYKKASKCPPEVSACGAYEKYMEKHTKREKEGDGR